jgi:hypothetical protein
MKPLQIINACGAHLGYNTKVYSQWVMFLTLVMMAQAVKGNTDTLSVLPGPRKALSENVPAFKDLSSQVDLMPLTLKRAVNQLMDEFVVAYDSMSDHQKHLLATEEVFGGKVLSKKTNPKRYDFVMDAFREQLNYVRNKMREEGTFYEYVFFVNAAPHWHGGQRGYLINMRNGVMLEVLVSTGWKGLGFDMDSDKTPVGFFMANSEQRVSGWENKTILGSHANMFRKLQLQQWWDFPKWLHRVDTKLEKAYITSNQIALKGMNDGQEEVPLRMFTDYPEYRIRRDFNNLNTAMRHIYIHATNRNDQLGKNLSGGCVRVSNTLSYLLATLYKEQGYAMPVFIDGIKFFEGNPPLMPETPDDDFRQIERMHPGTQHLVSLSEFYHTISSFNFSEDRRLDGMRHNIDLMIVQPLAERLMKDKQAKVTLKVSSTVPFPEEAMLDWLRNQDNVADFANGCYRHTFDLFGNLSTSKEAYDLGIKATCSAEKAHEVIGQRIDFTQQYILNGIRQIMQEQGKDVKGLERRVNFVKESVKMKGRKGELADLGFVLHKPGLRVLENMTYLDSLAQAVNADSIFMSRSELRWISSYLKNRVQVFTRAAGNRLYQDTITYEKALLAQAYIYTLGEHALRKDFASQRLIEGVNDPALLAHFDSKDKMMERFDHYGQLVLINHTNGTQTKLPYRLRNGEVKLNSQRIQGIIQVSEEIFSKRKQKTNQISIQEVPQQEVLSANI